VRIGELAKENRESFIVWQIAGSIHDWSLASRAIPFFKLDYPTPSPKRKRVNEIAKNVNVHSFALRAWYFQGTPV
jgi:hypothetical protein